MPFWNPITLRCSTEILSCSPPSNAFTHTSSDAPVTAHSTVCLIKVNNFGSVHENVPISHEYNIWSISLETYSCGCLYICNALENDGLRSYAYLFLGCMYCLTQVVGKSVQEYSPNHNISQIITMSQLVQNLKYFSVSS